MAAITKVQRLHGAYMSIGKKKGQPVRIGLDSLGNRIVARFPKLVPGAGIEGSSQAPEIKGLFISLLELLH